MEGWAPAVRLRLRCWFLSRAVASRSLLTYYIPGSNQPKSPAKQCMAMDKAQDETALETIELLESRLQRVQFLLTGRAFADADVLGIAGAEDEDCIPARLERLEKALMDISATSRVAHDALNLCQLPALCCCACGTN